MGRIMSFEAFAIRVMLSVFIEFVIHVGIILSYGQISFVGFYVCGGNSPVRACIENSWLAQAIDFNIIFFFIYIYYNFSFAFVVKNYRFVKCSIFVLFVFLFTCMMIAVDAQGRRSFGLNITALFVGPFLYCFFFLVWVREICKKKSDDL